MDRYANMEKLLTLFSQFGSGSNIYVTDLTTKTTLVGREMLDQFDLPATCSSEIIETWTRLVHPEDLEDAKRLFDEILSGKDIRSLRTYRVMTRQGTYESCLARNITLRDENGLPAFSLGTITLEKNLHTSLLRQYIINHFEEAVEKNWIQVYYHPIIRSITHQICSAEALARWQDPVHGLIMPQDFISTLEDYRLIHLLDLQVARIVCEERRSALDRGLRLLPISINLSALDFELCDIFEEIHRIVSSYGLPPSAIKIEITESGFSQKKELIQKAIQKFHQAGYDIWMDDFGSAYSSFNTLREFDVDVLKIDMAFLKDFNLKSQKILLSIINMAKELGIQTLCEGIETKAQEEFLHEAGCEKLQGFLYARPVPISALPDFLHTTTLALEEEDHVQYYDTLGQINLLSRNPFRIPDRTSIPWDLSHQDFPEGPEEASLQGEDSAFLLMELQDNVPRHIAHNLAFMHELNSIGIPSIEDAMSFLQDGSTPLFRNLMHTANLASETGNVEKLNFTHNGMLCLLKFQVVARCGPSTAFLCKLRNISNSFSRSELAALDESIRDLYKIYQEITEINVRENSYRVVFQSNRWMEHYLNHGLQETADRFTEKEILPEDKERYAVFIDTSRWEKRLKDMNKCWFTDYFRVKSDPTYRWKQLTIISKEDGIRYIVCTSDIGTPEEIHCLERRYGSTSSV